MRGSRGRVRSCWNDFGDGLFTSSFRADASDLGSTTEAEEKRCEAFELARRLGLRPFLDCLQSDTVPAASLLSEDAARPAAAIGLTPRQRSILSLIAKGLTNKEIASHLNLSARTIEMHVALALERLNCRTRSEGVSRAFSQGLLGIKD
jgi:DNA-binding NarL/FixJ family response regulator